MFINYAHRGASEYAPENTFAAFYLGLEMEANGIETDVQYSKDGALVLFHDDTLKRITGENIAIKDLTLAELRTRDIGSFKSIKYKNERIVTLEDFLRYFSGKDLTFAIEIKAAGVEKETVKSIYEYSAQNQSVITSFMLDSIKLIRSIDSSLRLSYLARDFSKESVDEIKALGIGEYCPPANQITKEMVEYAKSLGLGVRAWGVSDIGLMNACLDAGVDGMTINFPDKLRKALISRGML